MRELEKRVGRAWRRLRMRRFLAALVVSLSVLMVLGAAVVTAERAGWIRGLIGPAWLPLAVAGGLAFVIATLVALISGASRLDAALALDRAFGLNERISTALSLAESARSTPVVEAMIADAVRHAKDLDVGEKIAVGLPRRAWAPVLAGALAAAALLIPVETLQAVTQKAEPKATPEEKEAIAKRTEALKKAIAQKREQLDPNKFAETAKLLAEVEKATEELSKSDVNKDQAQAKINKITDAVKERRKDLGSTEQISRQLQQLKEMAIDGPGEKFAKDLANNDFKAAAEAVKELKEKLAQGKLSEEEKKKLGEQLKDMKQQLDKLANMEERKKQLEEAKAKGAMTEEQFNKEMAKLEEQAKGMEQMKNLANQLAKAGEKMAQGDNKGAAEELGMTEQELQELAQNLQELESLDAALADLQDAKNGMAGEGLNQLGEGMGQFGMGNGQNNGNGNGLGRGQGQGDRPIAPDDTSAYSTKVKQQFGKGKGVIEGLGPKGAQTKGESLIEGQATVEAAAGLAAEALTNQKVPNTVKKHITGYFDSIKKGE